MTNNTIRGSTSRHSEEWKLAWGAVARLAATRQDVLRGARHDDPPLPSLDAARTPDKPVDREEYARAIAEIEQASAALRRAEPGLEAWRPEFAASTTEKRNSRSVWILVTGIWISTVAVFAGAISAILYLLG